MRSRIALAFAAAALIFLLESCSGKSANKPGEPPPPTVLVSEVKQQDVSVYGTWVATLDGYVNANIQPQVSGYLVKQNYREGSFVHKGDVLFEIDPRPAQAALDQAQAQVGQARGQLAQAQAQLKLAEINVNRDTPLAEAHAIAQSQLDNDLQTKAQNEAQIKSAQANIQTNEAQVETAKLNLGFTHVQSLIDGIAGIATTQIGNLVNPTTVLTSISQVDPIKVYFSITEQEYLGMANRLGMKSSDLLRANTVPLQLTLSDESVYPREGRIVFADRQVNAQTGTIRMVGAFPNPGNVLRPGQFGRVRALTSLQRAALLVPQKAVSELQGNYQVAVVNPDKKIKIVTVQVGDRIEQAWVIKSGLKAGEQVVSEGTSKVRDGVTVNPKPDTTQGNRK